MRGFDSCYPCIKVSTSPTNQDFLKLKKTKRFLIKSLNSSGRKCQHTRLNIRTNFLLTVGSRQTSPKGSLVWRKSFSPSLISTWVSDNLLYLYSYKCSPPRYQHKLHVSNLNLPKNFNTSREIPYNSYISLVSRIKFDKDLTVQTRFNSRNPEIYLTLVEIQQLIKDYSLLSTFITNLLVTPFRSKTRFSFSKVPYFSSLDISLFSPSSAGFKPSYIPNPYRVDRLKQNVRLIYKRFYKNMKYNLFNIRSGLLDSNLTLARLNSKPTGVSFKKPLKFVWFKRSSTRNTLFLHKPGRNTLSYKLVDPTLPSRKQRKLSKRRSYLRLKVKVKRRKFNGLRFKLKSSLRSKVLIDNSSDLINYNYPVYKALMCGDSISTSETPVLNKLISPKKNFFKTNTTLYSYALCMINPVLYKLGNLRQKASDKEAGFLETQPYVKAFSFIDSTNLKMSNSFRKVFKKKAFDYYSMCSFSENVIPIYHNTLIRFLEHSTGSPVVVQFYPFMYQNVTSDWAARYKYWLPRMRSYERSLGHKFFLEEALHIMHLSFSLRDSKLFSSWLKAIILRISFWRTRSIFRFLKYLMISHFSHVFKDLKVRGLKIKLKGKISVAGNSRKRSILYRVGKTSHSELNLRVDHTKTTVNTFTGVMGFQIWIFY